MVWLGAISIHMNIMLKVELYGFPHAVFLIWIVTIWLLGELPFSAGNVFCKWTTHSNWNFKRARSIGLFITEKSCHKLNINAMDKKPSNSALKINLSEQESKKVPPLCAGPNYTYQRYKAVFRQEKCQGNTYGNVCIENPNPISYPREFKTQTNKSSWKLFYFLCIFSRLNIMNISCCVMGASWESSQLHSAVMEVANWISVFFLGDLSIARCSHVKTT